MEVLRTNFKKIAALFFCIALSGYLSAQPNVTKEICINGVKVTDAPDFLDDLPYTFKLTEYDEEDLDQVDKIYYYNSDSLDVVFTAYEGVVNINRINVKCYSCSFSCEGSELSLGSPISTVIRNYTRTFMGYAEQYYPGLLRREALEEIPDFTYNFIYQTETMTESQTGIILFRFSDQKISEIFIRFVPE